MLDDRLPVLVEESSKGRPLLLGIVSVRHLPEINETLGYEYGDGLLAALGTRLRTQLGDHAVSARLGGAEIAVLQQFDGHLPRAEQSMRDLLTAIGGPVQLPGGEVDIELSAGIAAGPVHAADSRGLLRCAVDALRRAKATESEVEVYDPAQDVGRDFGPRLLPELIGALDSGLIVATYEPIVDLSSGLAVDLEAKLRWVHAEHGVLDASTLRPLAARAGLTRRLTRVLMADAVRRCAWWRSAGLELGVTLDLTTTDVLDSRLPYELARLVSEAGVPPASVQLELAEDLLLVDPGRTRRALSQLRTLGVRLALDHYGRSGPLLHPAAHAPRPGAEAGPILRRLGAAQRAGRVRRPRHGEPGPVARHPGGRRRRRLGAPALPGALVRCPARARSGRRRCDVAGHAGRVVRARRAERPRAPQPAT